MTFLNYPVLPPVAGSKVAARGFILGEVGNECGVEAPLLLRSAGGGAWGTAAKALACGGVRNMSLRFGGGAAKAS